MENTNKGEIIKKVALETGLSQSSAADATNAVFDAIAEALNDQKKVSVAGFGTFEPRNRAARVGVNPRTGDKMDIPASCGVSFRLAKKLKDLLNQHS